MPYEELRADVAVVGMGPGGEEVGAGLARAGRSVIGIDGRLVGGECPYYACVPTKMMIRASDALAEATRVGALAGSATVTPDWAPVAERIRREATDNWDDQVAVERFENAGGTFLRGWARLDGLGRVVVSTSDGERVVVAPVIVLNPGTEPAVPPIEGLAGTPFWTNREAVAVEAVPESLIVLGGGPVGCEFAQVFSRFGADVTLVQSGPRLLPRDEPEASELLVETFESAGVSVRLGARASGVSYDDGRFTVEFADGSTVSAARLLVAAGRRTDLVGLGVASVGLDADARGIEIDDRMRAADGVWAIGDVTGRGAFTHMSMYQASVAVADILGEEAPPADYRAVPRVTFTDPEVGAVGLTEAQARERGLTVRIGITRIPHSSRGFIHKVGNAGFIKVVEDVDQGVLVGATSAGPAGGEVLGALAVAVHGRVPVSDLRRMIFAYPTFHRAIESAIADLTG